MVKFLSKIHPICHNIVNGIKPGSNSTNDKHAAECSNAVCWGIFEVIYVRCINCPYNNIAKGIRLHDNLHRKKFIQVRAFERNISLTAYKDSYCYVACEARSTHRDHDSVGVVVSAVWASSWCHSIGFRSITLEGMHTKLKTQPCTKPLLFMW